MQDFKQFVLSTSDKKDPMLITSSMPQYPTGYMYLDYGTGSYITICDDDESPLYTYHNIGITGGSVMTLISKSQGGKTSLAISMGVAIIEPYITKMLQAKELAKICKDNNIKNSFDMAGMPFIQILDTEKTLPIDYAKKVARYTNKLTNRHIMINPITTDRDLIKALEKHIKYKVDNMSKMPMVMLDIFGKPIMEYPPTVLIIDSMSQLLLEDCDDPNSKNAKADMMAIYNNSTQNTAGARRAKTITALYSQLVNYAKRYNIIIFSINHINKMLPTMGIPVKQYRGLRAGETINGGEKAIYLTANILRLDVIKNVSSEGTTSVNLGDGVTGFVSIASWIKSKSNSKSNKCQLVYTNKAGYDPLLSNLWYGKEIGDLNKSGNNFYITGYENYKFTLKNYESVFSDHPELFSAYYDELRDKCESLLDNPDQARKADKKLLNDIRDDIREEYGKSSDSDDLDDLITAGLIND